MWSGRRSGTVLAAAIGLLALAPAPAAAAGAQITAGKDTAGAASGRSLVPVFRSAANLPAGVTRAAPPSRAAVLPPGIGPNIQMSPNPTNDRFSETAVAI